VFNCLLGVCGQSSGGCDILCHGTEYEVRSSNVDWKFGNQTRQVTTRYHMYAPVVIDALSQRDASPLLTFHTGTNVYKIPVPTKAEGINACSNGNFSSQPFALAAGPSYMCSCMLRPLGGDTVRGAVDSVHSWETT
jgi:hypothetical protein